MSEESFRKVINTLRNNKVTVSVKKDGIYTRLSGNENNGEAFSKEFVNSYPFDNYKSKDQQIKDLEQKLESASERERLAFYWGQDSGYYEFSDYKNSEDYLQPKP